MATTLATFRAWLRLDLNDPAGSAPRFADADLDRAIDRALTAYSQVWPRLRDQTLTTTAGSRDVSVAALAGLWTVEEVEWPAGAQAVYPPALANWRLSPDRQTLSLLVPAAPGGEPVRVRWASKHTVDLTTSTVPEEHEALLALGAYGYVCLAYSTPSADNFRYEDGAMAGMVDDSMIAVEWRRRSEAALAEFRRLLGQLAVSRTHGARGRVVWSEPRPAPRYPATVDAREP